MTIFENTILELYDGDLNFESLHRILWISPDNTDIVVVDITDKKNMKLPFLRKYNDILYEIENGRERVIEINPDLRIISPDEEYISKYKDERDEKWNIIKDFVIQEPDIYIAKYRGKLVTEIVENTGKSKKEIYKYLKRYWFYGKSINGLLKDYFDCGAPGRGRVITKKTGPKSKDGNNFIVTENDKKNFEWAINKFHVKGGMDLTRTHQHLCEGKYNSGYYRKFGEMIPIIEPEKAPTLRQFLYWYHNQYSLSERYAKRHGKRKATMDVRPLLGDSTEHALGVGYLYEIDSTPADVILVAEDRETNIGTPNLYIVKDVFSRMVTGFYTSLAPPSAVEQMMALENAATNKVEFCRQYGIEIEEDDWPCFHLPQNLLGDRGELKSKQGGDLVNLKMDVINAPSYRGDLKPFVEQHFRITNQKIRELLTIAGAKPGRPKQRGEINPSKKAALTIYEFTQFMILQTITFNKSALNKEFFVTREMFEDKVELTPLDVWNWGKRKRLLHEEPRDVIRYNLLPKEQATVTRHGIEFNLMCYTCKRGVEEGWFESERIEGEKKITVSYDPRNVSSIFLRRKNGRLEQCFLTQKFKDYEGLHIEDVKAIMKYKKDQLYRKEREEKQYQAELHAYTKKLATNAIEQTNNATKEMSFYEREKNKREQRKSESRKFNNKNSWTTTKSLVEKGEGDLTGDVINYPVSNNSSTGEKVLSDVHTKFSSKIKERRRNNESLE